MNMVRCMLSTYSFNICWLLTMCWVIQERAREVYILKDLTGRQNKYKKKKPTYIKIQKNCIKSCKRSIGLK